MNLILNLGNAILNQTKPVACQDFETNSIFVVSLFMFQYYISKTTFEKGKIAKVI